MPVKTQQIANNLQISAPVVSPVITINNNVTDIQSSLTITSPTNTDALMQLNIERSTDGGNTWVAISESFLSGGTQQKGANIGQPLQETITVDVINPASGDKYRANAVSVSGGTFTISATLTTTS